MANLILIWVYGEINGFEETHLWPKIHPIIYTKPELIKYLNIENFTPFWFFFYPVLYDRALWVLFVWITSNLSSDYNYAFFQDFFVSSSQSSTIYHLLLHQNLHQIIFGLFLSFLPFHQASKFSLLCFLWFCRVSYSTKLYLYIIAITFWHRWSLSKASVHASFNHKSAFQSDDAIWIFLDTLGSRYHHETNCVFSYLPFTYYLIKRHTFLLISSFQILSTLLCISFCGFLPT